MGASERNMRSGQPGWHLIAESGIRQDEGEDAMNMETLAFFEGVRAIRSLCHRGYIELESDGRVID